MKKYYIELRILSRVFPNDTLWIQQGHEIIGYSPSENKHIVIEDGVCWTDDGEWLVHIYQPKNPEEHKKNWYDGNVIEGIKYPMKYLVDENYATKIEEKRMKLV